MRRILFLALLLGALLMASPAQATPSTSFGRAFPQLEAYDSPSDSALFSVARLNGPMFDPNLDDDDTPQRTKSFFTYWGQQVDHDLTLDQRSALADPVDPSTLTNFRTPVLDLDSVYGGGPDESPELYDGDKFRLSPSGRDVPRNPDGSAVIGEGRNDENQVVLQIHVALERFHNAMVDRGYGFGKARRLTQWHAQYVTVNEFLRNVIDPTVYDQVFPADGKINRTLYSPQQAKLGDLPVEFTAAFYRFGHSEVRRAYTILQNGGRVQVFNANGVDLRGGRPLTPDRFIFWPNFIDVDGVPQQPVPNIKRKIDQMLSSGLFVLPIPGAAQDGPSILAVRNMQRAAKYGLPSGQDIAHTLGYKAYTNQEIATAIPSLSEITGPEWNGELPAWLYMLAESKITSDGARIGPTGSRVIAETFAGIIAGDPNSYYSRGWSPEEGEGRAQDFLRVAGLL